MRFQDREEAGKRLASLLMAYRDEDTIVLALPRGGLPVGYIVAHELGAPLDVIVVRKIGAPMQPEFAIGALAEGGELLLDHHSISMLGISMSAVERIAQHEADELMRRVQLFRGGKALPDLGGKTVIVIDDGLATGLTARAALRCARHQQPKKLVLAVPVAARESIEAIRDEVDDLVFVHAPYDFQAVGLFYRDFSQISDQEALSWLERARKEHEHEAAPKSVRRALEQEIRIPLGAMSLSGNLTLPEGASGLVLFAHGSGSSRHSPRNRYVASVLAGRGLGTLLFDLLTSEEEAEDAYTGHLRFDIDLLTSRLVGVTDWIDQNELTRGLAIGYFGASTGAAAALMAASVRPEAVKAVVSRGGRPDLAAPILSQVRAPTLLIVGGRDETVLAWNEEARDMLNCKRTLKVVPGATHLFEEPGTLEEVARLSADWFSQYLVEELRVGQKSA